MSSGSDISGDSIEVSRVYICQIRYSFKFEKSTFDLVLMLKDVV